MKKILLVIVLLIISISIVSNTNKPSQKKGLDTQSPPSISQTLPLETSYGRFSAVWFKLNKSNNMLFSINTQRLSSTEIVDQHSCDYLVNGGFYDEEFSPLGLVTINSERVQQPISSSIFDGFLSFDNSNNASINKTPSNNPLIEIQTGPIILFNRQKQDINQTGKLARRILAITDKDSNIFFVVLYDPENIYNGPPLSEIHDMVMELEKNLHTTFESVINLDGGSASVFYTKAFKLPEVRTIGSYFCIREVN